MITFADVFSRLQSFGSDPLGRWPVLPQPMTPRAAVMGAYLGRVLQSQEHIVNYYDPGLDTARLTQWLNGYLGPYPSLTDADDPDVAQGAYSNVRGASDPKQLAQVAWEAGPGQVVIQRAMTALIFQLDHAPTPVASLRGGAPWYGYPGSTVDWAEANPQVVNGWWGDQGDDASDKFLLWLRGDPTATTSVPPPAALLALDPFTPPADFITAIDAALTALSAPERVPLGPDRLRALLTQDYPTIQPSDVNHISYFQWTQLPVEVQGYLEKKREYLISRWNIEHADHYNFFSTPVGFLFTGIATALSAAAIVALAGPAFSAAIGISAPVEAPAEAATAEAVTAAAPAPAAASSTLTDLASALAPDATPDALLNTATQSATSEALSQGVTEVAAEAAPAEATAAAAPATSTITSVADAVLPDLNAEALLNTVVKTAVSQGLQLGVVPQVIQAAQPVRPTITPRPAPQTQQAALAGAAAYAATYAATHGPQPVQALPGHDEGATLPGQAAGSGMALTPQAAAGLLLVLLGGIGVLAARSRG